MFMSSKFKQSVLKEAVAVANEINDELVKPLAGDENAPLSSGEIVLMQTAKVQVKNPKQDLDTDVRILLDSGS